MKHSIRASLGLLLTITMLFTLSGCFRNISGLGTLDITSADSSEEEKPLAPLGSSDSKDSQPTPESEPEPTPEPTPEPEPAPEPEPDGPDDGNEFVVEQFSCTYFDCYIPQGWNVTYQPVDVGGGTVRIYVFIQDPTDPNNIIFCVSAMEPFFTSVNDRNAFIAVGGSTYEWAPLLNDLSAEGVLEQWSSLYTMMDLTGFNDGVKFFKNYNTISVLDSAMAEGSNEYETASQVLAEVSIPGASQNYGMLYSNDLMVLYEPYSRANYYVSYSNLGFVMSADRFNDECQGLYYCTTSFDFSKFNSIYGNTGFTANEDNTLNLELVLPENIEFSN